MKTVALLVVVVSWRPLTLRAFEPSFYLEVDLMQIPEIAYAPGSPFAVDLATRFNANAGINELDVMFLAWAATGFA